MSQEQSEPRYQYEVRIPKDATPEEIDNFMKEFVKRWTQKPNEPSSKPGEASSQSS